MTETERDGRGRSCSWIVSAVLAAALVLWRCPIMADMRPQLGPGVPFERFVAAWLPEAIAIGLAAIALRLCLAGGRTPSSPLRTGFSWAGALVLWLVVWAFSYLWPGWMVIGPLADDLAPLAGNFSLSNVAWLVNLSAVAIIVLVYAPFVLASLIAGVVLAAALLPAWRFLASAGAASPAGAGFWRRLGLVLVLGALFWLWRALAAVAADPSIFRAVADAVVIALLMRVFVVRAAGSARAQ